MSDTAEEMKILFTPIELGSREIKNRLVMASTTSGLGDHTGAATERNEAYLERRAQGGAGMIVTEALHVHPTSNLGYNQLAIHDDRYIAPLSRVATRVQQHGARIIGQLIHVGRQWHSSYSRLAQWAPSQSDSFPVWLEQAHEMDTDQIAELVNAFGEGARRVMEAGFDGVEIHAAHGFLIQQFASPLANKRTDRYGGSAENRLRFLFEVVDAIRAQTPSTAIIGLKFSAEEMVPGGITLEDTMENLALLERERTLDYYLVSAGGFDSIESIHPTTSSQVTPFIKNAAAVKGATQVPVIAIGKIKQEAGTVISEGKADMVAFARPLICDPDVPNKMHAGRMEEIRSCLSCNECHHRIWHNRTIGCAYNPETGHEWEGPLRPAAVKKHVVVVGGGPAGCEAARTAASRGHQVTLLEKGDSLGGRTGLAAMLDGMEDLAAITLFYAVQLDTLGVDVRLDTEATAETVLALEPDAIVVATGTVQHRPEIPGAHLPHVFDPDTVIAEEPEMGGRVLVYDQEYHLAGSGTAELLATQGKQVLLATPYHLVGGELEINTSHIMHKSLALKGVRTLTNTRLRGIEAGRVTLQNRYGTPPWSEDADAVVICTPGRSADGLYRELKARELKARPAIVNGSGNGKGSAPALFLVGDAFSPRRIMAAVRDGYTAMRDL